MSRFNSVSLLRLLAIALLLLLVIANVQRDSAQANGSGGVNTVMQLVVTNKGSYSYIETTNPTVSSGGWTYIRTASTSGAKFVEVGMIKDPAQNAGVPIAFWVAEDDSGNPPSSDDLGYSLITGTKYNYQVELDSGTDWDIYWNELNSVDKTEDIDTSTTSTVWVGAETDSTSDDVGDSDNLNSTYKNSSGTWTDVCTAGLVDQGGTNYSAEDDNPSCNDFRVWDT